MKKNIDKTMSDWIKELFLHILHTLIIIGALISFTTGRYLPGPLKTGILGGIVRIIGFLLYPISGIMVVTLIVRIIGILMEIFLPPKKALSLKVNKESVEVHLKKAKVKRFHLKDIVRIIITYDNRGFLIRTKWKQHLYKIKLEPRNIEKEFGKLNMEKEISSIQNSEGGSRLVYFKKNKTQPNTKRKYGFNEIKLIAILLIIILLPTCGFINYFKEKNLKNNVVEYNKAITLKTGDYIVLHSRNESEIMLLRLENIKNEAYFNLEKYPNNKWIFSKGIAESSDSTNINEIAKFTKDKIIVEKISKDKQKVTITVLPIG